MEEETRYLRLIWAKTAPFKSILAHSLDTAAVANTLLTEGIFQTVLPDLAERVQKTRSVEAQGEIRRLITYLAALHDSGKISPFFSGKGDKKGICSLLKSDTLIVNYRDDIAVFRHEQYTRTVLLRIWEKNKRFERAGARRRDSTADNLALVLCLHHQGKKGKGKEIPECEARELWQKQQDIFENIMYELFQPPQVVLNSKSTRHVSAICMLLLGIVVMADWLASSNAFADSEPGEDESYAGYYCRVKERARRLVKESRLSGAVLPEGKAFTDVWPAIPRDGMRSLQLVTEKLMAAQEKPLLLLMEAPMGEGKTEAGVYAAFRMGEYFGKRGFYIALPTSAAANQMYGRMCRFMESAFPDGRIRLLHSLAWLTDEATKEEKDIISEDKSCVQEWTKPLRRGLLEGFSVGTIDQVLMSALYVQYGVLRLLGMQNKVLILDEVHAYDAYMQDILLRMLQWCRELCIPVVMLSATLATETKERIMAVYEADYRREQAYPAITAVFANGEYQVTPIPEVSRKRTISVQLEPILQEPEAVGARALQMIQDGGCLCVLVNTVGQAQKLYQSLKERKNDDIELYLFHARFAERRKQKLENQMIEMFGPDKSKRPQKAIVVTSQIMEQSLDVDFDFMITEAAPIDLLLQRFGRLFRHDNTPRPVGCCSVGVTVLVPGEGGDYGASELIYPRVLLELTVQYLEQHGQLACPESIREAVEFVYGSGAIQRADLEKWMERMFQEDIKRSQAKSYELREPGDQYFDIYESNDIFEDSERRSFQSAKTRLAEPTVRIAVIPAELFQRLERGEYVSGEFAKEIFLHSVSVREQIIKPYYKALQKAGMLEGEGLLKYMLILSGEKGRVQVDEAAAFDLNEELGFVIWGGGEN